MAAWSACSTPSATTDRPSEWARPITDDPASTEIVASVVHLAHALGKDLVAEGVETAGQLAVVRRLGADAAQGYHLARPMPAADLEALLATGPRW